MLTLCFHILSYFSSFLCVNNVKQSNDSHLIISTAVSLVDTFIINACFFIDIELETQNVGQLSTVFHCKVFMCIELDYTGQLGDHRGFAWWSFQCSGAREPGRLHAEEEEVAHERLAQGN